MPETTTTVRVRRETRDTINCLAEAEGVSATELVGGSSIADDRALFAALADACDALRRDEPHLLAGIEAEDAGWDRSDLARPSQA